MRRKDPPTVFARAVRDARDVAHLSQAGLAALLGVAVSTIYRIEHGHAPREDVQAKLRKWWGDLPPVSANENDDRPTLTGTEN
ncbi:MAG: hypothetical protein NVS3B10_31840 [Polyangiales bacterium]